MRCPACRAENSAGRRFCGECGGQLEQVCPSCQSTNEPDVRFCGACGASLTDSAAAPAAPASGSTAPSSRPAAAAVPAAPLPQSLGAGRYRIERLVGEGGKKRVYLARDTRLNREVAISVIKGDGLDSADRARAQREAEAMAQLGDHAHIVTVFDIGVEGDQLYLVSQYVGGGDLEVLLADRKQGLAIDEALRIGEQVCLALEYAHGRGVVHRDVKPGNVWLAADGAALLGDFGLAAFLDRSRVTQEGAIVGTVSYMPPEQALGRTLDRRSDLYAFGAMLYELVTGHPPFVGEDAVAVVSQHIHTAPISPSWHNSEVPPDLERLILALLAKKPEERPESAGAVGAELRRIRERPAGVKDETAADPGAQAAVPIGALGGFVGRREELEQLKEALGDALSGKGSLCMLVGEPGIGKSRLAEELSVYAELRGAQVWTGRCYEGELAMPYRPFVEAFRQHVRDRPDDSLRQELGAAAPEIARLVSEVRERFPDIPQAPALDSDMERLRLFESVTEFLRNAASSKPLVLFLDDLHWADKPSLLLLQYIARNLAGERILVLGAYRDVELERTHALSEVLGALRREAGYRRVLLRGLPADELFSLLSVIDPDPETEPGRRQLAAALHEETKGNPFFVREVLRHLVEERKLFRQEGRWQINANSISELGIPEGVREVVGRRLSRLSDGCNRMLTLASTMTDGFSWEALKAVTGEEEAGLLDLLEEALAAQLVVEREGDRLGRYDFTHALIRQTLYEELSTPRRVLLHRQIGEALERLYAQNLEPHLSELAQHFYQAAPGGDVAKAIDYARRAGDRAVQLLAFEEGAEHYELAVHTLDLAEKVDERQRIDLLLALGDAYIRANVPDRAMASLESAVQMATAAGEAKLQAEATLRYAEAAQRGHLFATKEPVRVIERALERLGPGETALHANLLAELARARINIALIHSEPIADADRALARQAKAIAEASGDADALSRAFAVLQLALQGPAFTEERLSLGSEAVEIAERAADLRMALWVRLQRMADLAELGDMAAVDRELEVLFDLGERTREPAFMLWQPIYRCMRAAMQGRYPEAEGFMFQALPVAQRMQHAGALNAFAAQFYHIRRAQGRLAELEPVVAERRKETPTKTWDILLAVVKMESDRSEEARALFDVIADQDFRDIPRDSNFTTMIMLCADLARGLDDARRAELLYEVLQPWARRNIVPANAILCEGSGYLPLGKLEATIGRYDDAEGHFHEAIAFDEKINARPWLARTRYEYAVMLRDRAAPGDREKALGQLGQAVPAFQEMGMKKELERALSLQLEVQGVSSSPSNLSRSIDIVASTVHRRRPDLAPQTAPDGTVTLVFSDMEGFTVMTERLGDLAAREVIRSHNRIVREQLALHGGYEVELQGDGFLLAFASARRALQCAIGIQRAFEEHNRDGAEPIRVRIGLHTGEALKDADKFFGKTVILASRIAAQAKGGEILVSTLLRELVRSSGDIAFGASREVELKGISDPQLLYEVDWRI